MTNELAEAMPRELAEHYREPVLPMSRYCTAFRQWARCIQEAHDEDKQRPHVSEADFVVPRFADIVAVLPDLDLAICKSSLLARLLYAGETLRTVKCPEHGGRWSGLPSDIRNCTYGCDFTGWLP